MVYIYIYVKYTYNIHTCFWTNTWRCPLLLCGQWPRPTHSHSSRCSRRFLSYTKWQPMWISWIHATMVGCVFRLTFCDSAVDAYKWLLCTYSAFMYSLPPEYRLWYYALDLLNSVRTWWSLADLVEFLVDLGEFSRITCRGGRGNSPRRGAHFILASGWAQATNCEICSKCRKIWQGNFDAISHFYLALSPCPYFIFMKCEMLYLGYGLLYGGEETRQATRT